MNSNTEADLHRYVFGVLKSMNDQCPYCIVKHHPTWEIASGSDIDVFVVENPSLLKCFDSGFSLLSEEGYELEIKRKGGKLVVDLVLNRYLLFRFDCYLSGPHYSRARLKPAFFEYVVGSRRKSVAESRVLNEKQEIYVADEMSDAIVRYMDYIENIAARPDKVKHVEYLSNKLDDSRRTLFLDLLHYFISLPDPKMTQNKESLVHRARWVFEKIRNNSFRDIVIKSVRHLSNRKGT